MTYTVTKEKKEKTSFILPKGKTWYDDIAGAYQEVTSFSFLFFFGSLLVSFLLTR